jgi:hypothetical protein
MVPSLKIVRFDALALPICTPMLEPLGGPISPTSIVPELLSRTLSPDRNIAVPPAPNSTPTVAPLLTLTVWLSSAEEYEGDRRLAGPTQFTTPPRGGRRPTKAAPPRTGPPSEKGRPCCAHPMLRRGRCCACHAHA